VIAGLAVDQFTQDVHLTGVTGGLLENVDEYPAQ